MPFIALPPPLYQRIILAVLQAVASQLAQYHGFAAGAAATGLRLGGQNDDLRAQLPWCYTQLPAVASTVVNASAVAGERERGTLARDLSLRVRCHFSATD